MLNLMSGKLHQSMCCRMLYSRASNPAGALFEMPLHFYVT